MTTLADAPAPVRARLLTRPLPVQIPVDICGNAVGLLGFANASCVGGAAALLDDSGN